MHNFPSTAQGDAHINPIHLYRLWDAEEDRHYRHERRWATWDGPQWVSPVSDGHTGMVAIRTPAGQGTLHTLKGETYPLGPGSILILPWQDIANWRTTENHWRLWWFEFFLAQPEHVEPDTPFEVAYTDAEDARITAIQRDLRKPEPAHQRLASANFAALLYGWLAARNPPRQGSPQDQRIERVINAMHERINEQVSIAQFATIANLTPRAFATAFERATGTPPKRYFHHLRLETARSLLMTGRFTVQRIAEHMHFSSPFHFSRAYKKHFGHPPSKAH